jgi:DNA invertase Pin-like site-specific DNA recombinase
MGVAKVCRTGSRSLGIIGGIVGGKDLVRHPSRIGQILQLKAEGLGATKIAKRLKIGRASVYRLLEERAAVAG